MTSRNSGNAHEATFRWRGSKFSVKIMWNCRGSKKAATKARNSRVVQGPSRDRFVQGTGCFGVATQPLFEFAEPAEHAEQRSRPIASMATSLTMDSKAIAKTRPRCFSRGEMCRAPNRIANRVSTTQKPSAITLRRGFVGQHPHGLGDRADLQGDVGQGAEQHEQRDQYARQLTAITKGEQIGQRSQLIFARQSQYRRQQHRAENEGQRDAEIHGKEEKSIALRESDRSVKAPGCRVYAQRQGVDPGVVDPLFGNRAAIGKVGDQEQYDQIGDTRDRKSGRDQTPCREWRRWIRPARTIMINHSRYGRYQKLVVPPGSTRVSAAKPARTVRTGQ